MTDNSKKAVRAASWGLLNPYLFPLLKIHILERISVIMAKDQEEHDLISCDCCEVSEVSPIVCGARFICKKCYMDMQALRWWN